MVAVEVDLVEVEAQCVAVGACLEAETVAAAEVELVEVEAQSVAVGTCLGAETEALVLLVVEVVLHTD